MAHEIDQSTGQAACFVTGAPAWHKLGVVIDKAQSSREAIKLAGLNWKVEQWPVRALSPYDTSETVSCPGKVANVRSDTHAVLGVVSKGYRVFQNADAFDFMDALVGEKLAMYETAGGLRGGRRIWMLARLPGEYRATRDDLIKPYVLLTTGHDGKSPVQMLATTIRVVCQNTLNLALADGPAVTINHFTNLDTRIDEARSKLGIITNRFRSFNAELNRLTSTKLKEAQVRRYFTAVLPECGESELAKKLRENVMQKLWVNFENPRNTLIGMGGTAWGAYNAVSEYADHQKTWLGKDAKEKADSQLHAIWFGGSNDLKQVAFQKAMALSN